MPKAGRIKHKPTKYHMPFSFSYRPGKRGKGEVSPHSLNRFVKDTKVVVIGQRADIDLYFNN